DLDIVIPGYTEAEQLATTNGLPDMTQLGILS
ncbi:MAG: hypothetical protein ACI9MB_003574, partial [Verrucomicrobiales bacterium]